MKIKKLEPELIQKIAAGEVVERPASIVKELIENAIDSGADFIKVILEDGGKKKIQVIDNGSGIAKEEMAMAFERHSTSKIAQEDDLQNILTLGFRGEALFSIAGISQVEMESKTMEAETGAKLVIEGGKQEEVKITGCPLGTNIAVKNLFFNVPARLKFLKSGQTELKASKEIFLKEAISHPNIRMELWHEGKKLIQVPKQNFPERISKIYELPEEDLLPISFEHPYLKIIGLIGKPAIGYRGRGNQEITVNKRVVASKLVFAAVKKAYEIYLPQSASPLFFVNLEIRPDLIDVNIHPRKEEVKFASSSLIFESLKQAVEKTLRKEDLTPKAAIFEVKPKFIENSQANFQPKIITQKKIQEAMDFNRHFSFQQIEEEKKAYEERDNNWKEKEKFEELKDDEEANIFQVDLTYLVEITEKKILIFDQHALHERILFEKFSRMFLESQKQGIKQNLLFPEEMKLQEAKIERLKEKQILLEKIGFELNFAESKVEILAIPNLFENQNVKNILLEFIDDLTQNEEVEIRKEMGIDRDNQKAISYLSCRSAVKAGDYLSMNQRRKLIDDFEKDKTIYTCPHGRPVVMKITQKELEKLFGRK